MGEERKKIIPPNYDDKAEKLPLTCRNFRLNQFFDKLLLSKKRSFLDKYGPIELCEQRSTNVVGSAPKENTHVQPKANHDKIEFHNDEADDADSSTRKDDESYNFSYEKDLIASDSMCKFVQGKNFPCTFKNCKKVYTSSYGLKYHMDHGHTAEKSNEKRPYVCNIDGCGKTYKNNNGLKYHIMHAHKKYAANDTDMV